MKSRDDRFGGWVMFGLFTVCPEEGINGSEVVMGSVGEDGGMKRCAMMNWCICHPQCL